MENLNQNEIFTKYLHNITQKTEAKKKKKKKKKKRKKKKIKKKKKKKKKKKNVMAGRPSPFHNRTKFAQSKKLKHRTPIDIRGKTIKHQLSRMCFYDFFFSTTMIFLKELLQH